MIKLLIVAYLLLTALALRFNYCASPRRWYSPEQLEQELRQDFDDLMRSLQ